MNFRKKYAKEQAELTAKIAAARENVKSVKIMDDLFYTISLICSELDIDGLRGDLVTNRAAKALCAFEGRSIVDQNDLVRVMPLCLRHRLRKDPLETIDSGEKIQQVLEKYLS